MLHMKQKNPEASTSPSFDGQGSGHDFWGTVWMPPTGNTGDFPPFTTDECPNECEFRDLRRTTDDGFSHIYLRAGNCDGGRSHTYCDYHTN
jgi:hypothetical protein